MLKVKITVSNEMVLLEKNKSRNFGVSQGNLENSRVAGSSLTAGRVIVNVSLSKTLFCCLVLVQSRKTRSDMAEKLLTGTLRIKTNQGNFKEE